MLCPHSPLRDLVTRTVFALCCCLATCACLGAGTWRSVCSVASTHLSSRLVTCRQLKSSNLSSTQRACFLALSGAYCSSIMQQQDWKVASSACNLALLAQLRASRSIQFPLVTDTKHSHFLLTFTTPFLFLHFIFLLAYITSSLYIYDQEITEKKPAQKKKKSASVLPLCYERIVCPHDSIYSSSQRLFDIIVLKRRLY